ncbi:hypothetical protein [Paraburkholderia youngii]|uniref:hypothetical protein n=1 Tax=Paraburkholderia youngii TaxID=2782701 RepID=UPI003D23642D
MTELVRGDVRAVEETPRFVCEKAQRKFLRSLNAACFDVKVIFRDHAPLSPKDQDTAATDLVEIVHSRIASIPSGLQAFGLEEGTDFESSLFSSVWLHHHHPNYPQSRWQPVGARWVPVASPADVQTTLDRKEGKIAAYRTRVSKRSGC